MRVLGGHKRAFFGLRPRGWLISLPVHLIAFGALYLVAVQLTQSEVSSTAAEVARAILAHEVKELALTAPELGDDVDGHPHRSFFTIHERDFEIDLFDADGTLVGNEPHGAADAVQGVREFLASRLPEKVWLETVDGRFTLQSLRRIEAQRECAACHEFGQLLGVLAAKLDLTPQIARVRERLRENLAVLFAGWLVATVLFAKLVERTIKRSARELRADLTAAERGEAAAAQRTDQDLLLDPVTADLHRSLREFLDRRREHESELAARMVHADQLASVGQLAAGLAHEIKNPLAGVACTLELLQEQLPDATQRVKCAAMREELARVDSTLALLLSSARPAPLSLANVDLAALLDEVRRFLTPALRRRQIGLVVELAGDVATARIDAAKIRQVLVNLVNNAAEAIERNGRITLRAGRLPQARGLVITVTDDGPGIDDEDRGNIFTPFFTTKSTGTGLGLTISKTLIEQHGGRLEVDSTPGRGTTFVLVLPQAADVAVVRSDAPSEISRYVVAGT